MSVAHSPRPAHVDVAIVGAGLSGVNAAYRIQKHCPDRSYALFEARSSIGGTWDLFTYPGVRSDSDMFTLGFTFMPWNDTRSLADGPSILRYIKECVDAFNISDRIYVDSRIVAAHWSSQNAMWTLTFSDGSTSTCTFLYTCTGYYDYDNPHDPLFAGSDDFTGLVVHPQRWPEDLDYAGKRVAVIGSGATAITLVPALAAAAKHVTMIQRSPTWIASLPRYDRVAAWLNALLPARIAHRINRIRKISTSIALFQFCRLFPRLARNALLARVRKHLGGNTNQVREHFTPNYQPWDQRLCATPGAEFFEAVRYGNAAITTGTIERFVPEGVKMVSGEVISADIIITATGLTLLPTGGIRMVVDGEPVRLPDHFAWHGALLDGIPNYAFSTGYTNSSWTLRADLSARLVCRILNYMRDHAIEAIAPHRDLTLRPSAMVGLSSGYVKRGQHQFPQQGHRGPWRMRHNYIIDLATITTARLAGELAPFPLAPSGTTETVG